MSAVLGSMFYTDKFLREVLGIKEIPGTLYHYTSIETLALILRNRTIRFSRLDGLNDPEEANAEDLPLAATLVFASCWTAQARESLAMWKMYTPDMQGVRIRLPSNPFVGRHAPDLMGKGGVIQKIDGRILVTRDAPAHGIVSYYVTGPNKIYYTDDKVYRNLQCVSRNETESRVELHGLGMVKNTYWSFEEEWRYTILGTFCERLLPSGTSILDDPSFDLRRYPVKETALYIPLDSTSLNAVDILLGPRVSEAQELIVQALLDKYTSAFTLERSSINVR